MLRCGLRSSERRTIDEEIETLVKGMDYDIKQLRGIINTYKEKKGDKLGITADMGSSIITDTLEMVERDKVQKLLQKVVKMFFLAYQEQTKRFEMNKKNVDIFQEMDLDEDLNEVTKKLEFLEK